MGSKARRASLSDALFSKTQQRVLGVLFGGKINPTVLTSRELKEEPAQDGFHSRVLAQPKIFLIGSDHERGKPGKARAGRTAQG